MRRRFVQINGELVEVGTVSGKPRTGPDIMPDIKPYQSMIDGSEISSRSEHRAHLKAHDCVEIGNDTQSLLKQYDHLKDHVTAPQQLRGVLQAQVDSMTHSQFKQMLRRDLEKIRWTTRKD